jgi:hypothetical protein
LDVKVVDFLLMGGITTYTLFIIIEYEAGDKARAFPVIF